MSEKKDTMQTEDQKESKTDSALDNSSTNEQVEEVKTAENENAEDQKKEKIEDTIKTDKDNKAEEVKQNEDGQELAMQTVTVKGKKKKKQAPFLRGGRGQAHVNASYNNTIVSVTDLNGAVLAWSSAGKCGFKGPRKATPYAAGVIVKSLIDKVKELGIKELDVFVKGVGTGRESAVRAFSANGFQINSIKDVTPVPHGGCRPPKRRRV